MGYLYGCYSNSNYLIESRILSTIENIRINWPIIATLIVGISAGIGAWFDMRNDLSLMNLRVVSLEENHKGDAAFQKLAQWNHTLRNTDQSNNELKHAEVDEQVESLRNRFEDFKVESAAKEAEDGAYNKEIERLRNMHSPPSEHVKR